jgi:hypothetical protein
MHAGFFLYEPSTELRFDQYSFSAPGYPGSAARGRFFFNQQLETEIWNVYQRPQNKEMKAFKHSIIPSLRWSYSPRDALSQHEFFHQKDAPRFDLFDHDSPDAAKVSLGTLSEEQRLGYHHLLTAGFGTRIVGRYGEDNNRRYEEHFGANISQDYDLIQKNLGRLLMSLFGAYSTWSFRTDLSMNVHTWKSDVRNEIAYTLPRFKLFAFQNIRRENKNYGGGGYLKAIGPWSFSTDMIYDVLTKHKQEENYLISYESPSKCWLFDFGINKVASKNASFYPNFRISYQEQVKKPLSL